MVDCDLSVPTMPCSTHYDGNINHAVNNLVIRRPLGWMEELDKLQDMATLSIPSASQTELSQTEFQVRFRQISPGVILPQQVIYNSFATEFNLFIQALMFVNEQRLTKTQKIYQLLKILKYLTGSSTSSYKIKYAVHETFWYKEPLTETVGDDLKKVIEHELMHGSFNSVRKDLKDLGITGIVLHKDSVEFQG